MRTNPGLSGAMRESIVRVPHLEQGGRTIESENGVIGLKRGIRLPFQAGARSRLSAIDA